MSIEIPVTTSKDALLATLKTFNIAVPARTSGRKTIHTESWAICRLLSTLATCGKLEFPLSLQHRDRPDFWLSEPTGLVGIEATEAVSEQYAAYCALAEREFPDALLEPSHFRWGSPKLSIREMRALLSQTQLSGEPWCGNSAESEWAKFIDSIVETKLQKAAKMDYVLFPRNWLTIYDNLPLPHIKISKAMELLRPIIAQRWKCNPSFDVVYIEHGPVIAELTATDCRYFELCDLW
jgi:hypothetical protein